MIQKTLLQDENLEQNFQSPSTFSGKNPKELIFQSLSLFIAEDGTFSQNFVRFSERWNFCWPPSSFVGSVRNRRAVVALCALLYPIKECAQPVDCRITMEVLPPPTTFRMGSGFLKIEPSRRHNCHFGKGNTLSLSL
ncbi:hypothetical protein CEXT_194741 [Caerostris extrusa]|uniref:Uncharacterized protein n=1 Tax=Caerostris extrusa TaxID=172846 RepID=A0AAV4PVA6_CAEEX|nr:hypothetical protein CEXT_194741 [Caerostris extrusa]